jgi:hypothetical protein
MAEQATHPEWSARVALSLFGVTENEGHVGVPDTELIVVRDLAAICGQTEYRASTPSDDTVQRYTDIVSTFAATGTVLPAPVGTIFRSPESVKRWLELHYGALTDAMSFIENRVAARVHVWRPGKAEEREAGSDLAAIAAEALRTLRRSAVATVPLRVEKVTGIVLSAAFLVDQELWKDFVEKVDEQRALETDVRLEVTGPWPPYDFVRMQLGA